MTKAQVWTFLGLGVFLGTVGLGCSSGDGNGNGNGNGSSSGPSKQENEAAEAFREEVCELLSGCCEEGATFSPFDCRIMISRASDNPFADRYNKKSGDKCLEELRAASENKTKCAWHTYVRSATCKFAQYNEGKKKEGEECTGNSDCGDTPDSFGVCLYDQEKKKSFCGGKVKLGKLGDSPCLPWTDNEKKSETKEHYPVEAGKVAYMCDPANSVCNPTTGACEAPVELGQSCKVPNGSDYYPICGMNRQCVSGKCEAGVSVGERCSLDTLECIESRCSRRGKCEAVIGDPFVCKKP